MTMSMVAVMESLKEEAAKFSKESLNSHTAPCSQDPGHLVIDEDGLSSEGQVFFSKLFFVCFQKISSQGPMTMSPLDVDYDMNYLNDDTPPAPGMVKTIGANGKVEWKRFVFEEMHLES